MGRCVSMISFLAKLSLSLSWSCLGVCPNSCSNSRRKCRAVIPRRSANASSVCCSRAPCAMSLSARSTVACFPIQAGVPGAASGRHRKHGRYPAISAAWAVLKNSTFSRLGRAGQTGRQYTPVVFTATKNLPSKRGSLANRA